MWGYSSAGRAPALHAGGQEFESLYLHHMGLQLSWLERTPDKREVDGSSPFKPTTLTSENNRYYTILENEEKCTLKTAQNKFLKTNR